ncbi:hypothetical protein [Rahnella sp. AA]|nr:hypothetical protein [Rahnella sp. AA]
MFWYLAGFFLLLWLLAGLIYNRLAASSEKDAADKSETEECFYD